MSDSVRPHRRPPTRLPRPRDSAGKNTRAGCHFLLQWKWKVKLKSLSRVRLLATSWTAAYQAPPSMGFSRQEYWGAIAFSEFYAKCINVYIFLLLLACTSFLFEFAWKSSSISWVLLNSQLPMWVTLNIEEKFKTDKYQQHASNVRGCFT